jgi:hypothetical protein
VFYAEMIEVILNKQKLDFAERKNVKKYIIGLCRDEGGVI